MRRTASEVLHGLEMRVARLERGIGRRASWDNRENYSHPIMEMVRNLEGSSLTVQGMYGRGTFTLTETSSGASVWESDDSDVSVYVSFDARKNNLIFSTEEDNGRPNVIYTTKGMEDSREFLRESKEALSML